jgi:hypothetical protein
MKLTAQQLLTTLRQDSGTVTKLALVMEAAQ